MCTSIRLLKVALGFALIFALAFVLNMSLVYFLGITANVAWITLPIATALCAAVYYGYKKIKVPSLNLPKYYLWIAILCSVWALINWISDYQIPGQYFWKFIIMGITVALWVQSWPEVFSRRQ